ncbi:MAG: MFS transporter [Anaerolineales bacterium]|nr:MFS transporter [Chloroflexota bacterium]MBL6983662.1 MFS transporter [Anaerolineales bacterium]
MRIFSVIWFGQLISTIGSGLTGFAMGVWIYEKTGSTTLFAMNILAYTLPTLLVSPFAGALVDRWDRRWAMIISDTGAGLSTLVIWLLYSSGNLDIWHIYVATAFIAAFSTFQWPAYSAATTLLVPKKNLGRASGMVQIGEAVSQLISPVVAGALFVSAGLNSIILIDFITFGFAVFTLLFVQVPKPEVTEEGKEGKGSLIQEAAFGWKYITARRGLLSLLLYFAAINFASGFFGPLLVPMMLDLAEPDTMGLVFSIVGLGMLFGTLIMSAWGGPKRRILGILIPGALMGLSTIFMGFRPSIVLIGASGFIMMLFMPVLNGSSQALWQSKTAPDVQGRVFSVRRMIAQFTQPFSLVLAGPLVDQVFQPLMDEGGRLAPTVGRIIGVGPSRGTGLLLILMGIFVFVMSFAAYLYPRLRLVEEELPDHLADEIDDADQAEKFEERDSELEFKEVPVSTD